MRSVPGREVWAVTFETRDGRRMRYICCMRQERGSGWRFAGGAGGGAESGPRHDEPWVNLGGGGWPQQFYAGGEVLDHGTEVARVRLRGANGVELEDTVDEGMVLFITDAEMELPLDAELLDGYGRVVSRHRALE